jgi:uncharacterized membrane protein
MRHDADDPPRAEDLSDTGRAEAFSDGVLAVAITLLVLDLTTPPHAPGGLFRGLVNLWPAYLGYLASFLFIGVIWINHHTAFRRIRHLDRGLSWANLGILLTAVLLPFPTAVLANALREGNAQDARAAAALYALIGALTAASWLAFYQYMRGHHHLLRREDEAAFFHNERLRAVFGIALYACAGLFGFLVSPLIALAVFVFLPVFYGVTSEGLRRSRAAPLTR